MSYSRPSFPDPPLFELDTRTRTDRAAVLAVELCLLDGLMTLPFWHLEGNPLVLSLGTSGMLLVKLFAVIGLLAMWFGWDGVKDSRVAQVSVWGVCLLYAVVVVTNVVVLILGV